MNFSFGLIQKGEGLNLELKREWVQDKNKFLKTVSAFSNTSGGFIVFGVDDKTKEIIPISENEQPKLIDAIANSISDNIEPQITPKITVETNKQGKSVVVVQIFSNSNCPYYIKSLGKEKGSFIRVGATSRLADEKNLYELELIGKRSSFDSIPCRELYSNDRFFNEEKIKTLCDELSSMIKKINAYSPDVTTDTLESLGLLVRNGSDLMPSIAFGILSSVELPAFEQSVVRCAAFKGTDKSIFLDRLDCSGPLYKQIEDAFQFVIKNIKVGMEIDGIQGKNKYEFPPEAIREAIVNAVVHRNYLYPEHVQIAIYEDRIDIISPGSLVHDLTLEQALDGVSKLRNPVLAKVFQKIGLMEEWGSGLRRIRNSCADARVNPPKFVDSNIEFKTQFFRGEYFADISKRLLQRMENIPSIFPKTAEQTFDYLKEHPAATNQEIAAALNISDRSVRTHCSILKNAGYINRTGSDKKGEWIILKDKEE